MDGLGKELQGDATRYGESWQQGTERIGLGPKGGSFGLGVGSRLTLIYRAL